MALSLVAPHMAVGGGCVSAMIRSLWVKLWTVAVCGGALAGAIMALAALGGRFSPWLDVLSHFAPLWLTGGVLAAVVAAVTLRGSFRWIGIAAAVVAVIASSLLIVPELTRPLSPQVQPAAGVRQIKIIQFNARRGPGERMTAARWIVAQQPDIIVMEEVTPAIRDAILSLYPYHLDCDRCGIVVMSRVKPVETGLRGEWLDHWIASMGRATFADVDGGFTVMGAHIGWPIPPGHQQASADQLADMLDHFPKRRLIVAGDFNATPWSAVLRRVDRRFGLERRDRAMFSWPAGPVTRWKIDLPFAFLPIDHIYAGSDWRTVKIERGPRGLGSDHRPLIITLALQPDTPPAPR